jgi:hypothetical protein
MVHAGTPVSKGGPRVVESWTRKRFTEASAAGRPCRRALPPAALPEYVQLTHSIADARMACRNHPCAGLALGSATTQPRISLIQVFTAEPIACGSSSGVEWSPVTATSSAR